MSNYSNSLQECFNGLLKELDLKYDEFNQKLSKVKESFKLIFKKKLFEIYKLNLDLTKLVEKSKKAMSLEDFKNNSEEIKRKSEEISFILEKLNITELKIEDNMSIKENNFVLFEENIFTINQIKNSCKSCHSKLLWTKSIDCKYFCNTKKCNKNYRYYCKKCNTKYCLKCYQPPDAFCGCKKDLKFGKRSTVLECDFCGRKKKDGYFCSECDYDLCKKCYIKKCQGNND